MLFNRLIEEEAYSTYNPLQHLMYNGNIYYDSDDITHKKYGAKRVFMNKSILIADILTREVIDTLPSNWGFNEGEVILLAFEFAKHNYKTQNVFLMKDQSELQKIFSKINSVKTKRLKEVSMPYRDDTFLAGVHFIGMVRFKDISYNDEMYVKRLLEENIDESREDGSFVFDLLEKEVYTYPLLENITPEDAYFIMKQARREYDDDYSGITTR